MLRKTPLWLREICWICATVALYLSFGWLVWEIWLASFTSPRAVLEAALPALPIASLIWLRRRIRRVVSGPLYRHGLKAYILGEMRHT